MFISIRMKKFFNTLVWVFILAVSIASIYLYMQKKNGVQHPKLAGYCLAVVETGSMEPNIPTGSLIVIQESKTYCVGDVVTYINNKDLSITHRIVNINNGIVEAKGDANSVSDPKFSEDSIVGKVIYTIPYMGKAIDSVKSPYVIGVLAILILILSLIDEKRYSSKLRR